jgi:hypothetical protein
MSVEGVWARFEIMISPSSAFSNVRMPLQGGPEHITEE